MIADALETHTKTLKDYADDRDLQISDNTHVTGISPNLIGSTFSIQACFLWHVQKAKKYNGAPLDINILKDL